MVKKLMKSKSQTKHSTHGNQNDLENKIQILDKTIIVYKNHNRRQN